MRDPVPLSGLGLPSAALTVAIKMSIAPHPPAASPQPLEKARDSPFCLSPGLSMPPLGSPFDDGSRKLRGAERPELKQLQRGTPADPPISRGLQIRRQKTRCVCSFANVDGFIHRPPPPPLPPALLLLFIPAQRSAATLQRASLIYSAPKPGDEKADRCLVTRCPAWGCCKEDADPLFSGSADKGAGGERPMARRCVVTLRAESPNACLRGPGDLGGTPAP